MAFDWSTLALEAVNFLILIWLLQHFLYRPVLAAIDRRREENAQTLSRADALRKEADDLRAEAHAERQKLMAERNQSLEEARTAAEEERQRLVEAARAEADAVRKDGRELLAHERRNAEAALRRHAARLAVDLAARLLDVTTNHHATDAFLDRACEALSALPEEERRGMIGPDEGMRVRIVSAEPLDEDRRRHCRERLAAMLGQEPEVDFADDRSLIAGVEIHFPHAVLRHNWRAALDEAWSEMAASAEETRRQEATGAEA